MHSVKLYKAGSDSIGIKQGIIGVVVAVAVHAEEIIADSMTHNAVVLHAVLSLPCADALQGESCVVKELCAC